MKKLSVLLLAVVVAAGCSTGLLEDEGRPIDNTLRLIGTNGQFHPLSDPTADDIAPQIVTLSWFGTNDMAVPTRFLYFVSDRSNGSPDLPAYAVYRAREVSTGVYTNLELVMPLSNVEKVLNLNVLPLLEATDSGKPGLVVSVESGSDRYVNYYFDDGAGYQLNTYYWPPGWPRTNIQPGGVTLLPANSLASGVPASTQVVHLAYTTNFVTNGLGVNGALYDSYGSFQTFTDYFSTFNLYTAPEVYPWPLSQQLKALLRYSGPVAGMWPFVFPQPGDPQRKVFGLVVSIGGRLVLAFNRLNTSFAEWLQNSAPPQQYATHPYFRGDGVLPLWMIEHLPGSRDITPSVDRRTGLYFSSDRNGAGKLDMYYVPLRAVFATASTNDPAVGL